MAQITFVNKNSATTAGATSITITKPTNTAERDVMVALINIESASDLINSVPTGWGTAVINAISGTRVIRQYVYVKVAGASEDASYQWGFSSSIEAVAIISTYRGVNNSTPYGNTSTSTSTSSTANTTAPTLTVQMAGNKVVWVGGNCYGTTYTSPGSGTWSERDDVRSGTGSTNLSGSMADYDPAAGATGNIIGVAANADYFHASAVELIADRITGAGGIASAEAVGTPGKIVGKILAVGAIASLLAFGDLGRVRDPSIKDLCGAIATGEAFGTPTVHGLAPTIISTAGDIDSEEAFGTAALKGKILSAGGIASAEGLGTTAIITGTIYAAGGIAGAEAVGTPALKGTVLAAGAIAGAEAFGGALVYAGAPATIQGAGGIETGEVVGTPGLKGTVLAAGGIASAEGFGTAYLNSKKLCGAIRSAEAFGTPALTAGGERIYDAGAIASEESFGTPALKGVIHAEGVASAEDFGIPWVYRIDFCGNIASEEAFGAPSVVAKVASQIRNAGAIPSAEAIGTPRIVGSIIPRVIATGYASGDARIKGTAQGAGDIPHSPELIINGDMENWISPTNLETWDEVIDGFLSKITREENEKVHGRYSVRMDIDADNKSASIRQSIGVPENDSCLLTIRYKIPAGKIGGFIFQQWPVLPVRYLRADGTWQVGFNVIPLPGTGAVTEYSIRFVSPASALYSFEIGAGGLFGSCASAPAYFDYLSLVSETVGTPKIKGFIADVTGIATSEAFGAPNVNAVVVGSIVGTGHIPSAEAFGNAALRGTITGAGAIATGEEIGDPDVMGGAIRPDGIPSEEVFGGTAIGGTVMDAGAIASAEAFGTARVQNTTTSKVRYKNVHPRKRTIDVHPRKRIIDVGGRR